MANKNFIFIGIFTLFLPLLLRGQQVVNTHSEKTILDNANVLSGTIFYDQNKNESFDNEPILRGWFVKAENTATGQTHWTATDETGQYQFKLDKGTYKINVITPNRYWLPYQQNIFANFTSLDKEASLNFAMKSATISPALQVDLVAPTFRACTENTYTVRYANNGTTTATDAFVHVNLDASLAFAGSSLPLTAQNSRTLRFNIGNIAPNEFGSFTVKARAVCSESSAVEQNLCTEAHIFPDTLAGLPIVRSTPTSSVVRTGLANQAGYNKMHIIIEDVIIFAMPINDDQQPTNQIDSSGIKRTNAGTSEDDSTNSASYRQSLQARQTAFFSDFPQNINTPSVYHLCHTVRMGSNLFSQNSMQSNNTSVWQSKNLLVYPNPMNETAIFEIMGNTNAKAELLIFDNVGQLLRQESFTGNKLLFHRKDLSTGVYFYKIVQENTPLSIGSVFIMGR